AAAQGVVLLGSGGGNAATTPDTAITDGSGTGQAPPPAEAPPANPEGGVILVPTATPEQNVVAPSEVVPSPAVELPTATPEIPTATPVPPTPVPPTPTLEPPTATPELLP